MVARNMLPENPSTRDFVETTLQENPPIERFLGRIQQHAQNVYAHPAFKIRKLAFDEWDPPLILEITADIRRSEIVDQFHHLLAWARADPDYDERVIQVMLLSRTLKTNAS